MEIYKKERGGAGESLGNWLVMEILFCFDFCATPSWLCTQRSILEGTICGAGELNYGQLHTGEVPYPLY